MDAWRKSYNISRNNLTKVAGAPVRNILLMIIVASSHRRHGRLLSGTPLRILFFSWGIRLVRSTEPQESGLAKRTAQYRVSAMLPIG
jgi:hypothetical protein